MSPSKYQLLFAYFSNGGNMIIDSCIFVSLIQFAVAYLIMEYGSVFSFLFNFKHRCKPILIECELKESEAVFGKRIPTNARSVQICIPCSHN